MLLITYLLFFRFLLNTCMLHITENTFPKTAEIECTIPKNSFSMESIRHFDNDGFQLNRLEQLYYRRARIKISECLGVMSAQQPWFTSTDAKLLIDHSFIVTRYEYVKDAKQQLYALTDLFPYLRKYTLLKPKWGIDFALEYAGKEYIEVVHIERDYRSYREAADAKAITEEFISKQDWKDIAERLIACRDQWMPLQGLARNDWKANYLGFDRAESTLKAF